MINGERSKSKYTHIQSIGCGTTTSIGINITQFAIHREREFCVYPMRANWMNGVMLTTAMSMTMTHTRLLTHSNRRRTFIYTATVQNFCISNIQITQKLLTFSPILLFIHFILTVYLWLWALLTSLLYNYVCCICDNMCTNRTMVTLISFIILFGCWIFAPRFSLVLAFSFDIYVQLWTFYTIHLPHIVQLKCIYRL